MNNELKIKLTKHLEKNYLTKLKHSFEIQDIYFPTNYPYPIIYKNVHPSYVADFVDAKS